MRAKLGLLAIATVTLTTASAGQAATECPAGDIRLTPTTGQHQGTLTSTSTDRFCLAVDPFQPMRSLHVEAAKDQFNACGRLRLVVVPPEGSGLERFLAIDPTLVAWQQSARQAWLPHGAYLAKVSLSGNCPSASYTLRWHADTLPAGSMPPAAATLTASPTIITAGASTTLSWQATHAVSCAASGGWSGTRPPSGSEILQPSSTSYYSLQCAGPGGNAPLKTVSVTVNAAPATPTLSASLAAQPAGGTAPLTTMLTATLGGTAAGLATVKFDCTNDGTWDATDASAPYSATCTYAAGSHAAKIEAVRNGVTAIATVPVTATAPASPETQHQSACANDWHQESGGMWDGDGNGTNCQCASYNQSGYSATQSKASCQPPWGFMSQPPIRASRPYVPEAPFVVNAGGDFLQSFQPSLASVPSQVINRACEDGFLPPLPPRMGNGYWLEELMTDRASGSPTNGVTIEFTPSGKQHRSFCFAVPPGTNLIRTTAKDLSLTCSGNFRHTLYKLDRPAVNLVGDGIHTGINLGSAATEPPPGIYVWDMAVTSSALYSGPGGWSCQGIQSLGVRVDDYVIPGGGGGPTLNVTLGASPAGGTAPLTTMLTAGISGTATGTATVKFDCAGDGTWDSTDTVSPYTKTCSYPAAGNYTARVEATRGGLTKTATVAIQVNLPPESQLCPDGRFDRVLAESEGSYGRKHLNIPPGTTKKFCAYVEPPLVRASPPLDVIEFQHYEEHDRDCGALSLVIEQQFGARVKLGNPDSYTNNGGVRFTRKFGRDSVRPEYTAHGLYLITARGGNNSAGCSTYYIGWAAN